MVCASLCIFGAIMPEARKVYVQDYSVEWVDAMLAIACSLERDVEKKLSSTDNIN
jgi:hypothetical protein